MRGAQTQASPTPWGSPGSFLEAEAYGFFFGGGLPPGFFAPGFFAPGFLPPGFFPGGGSAGGGSAAATGGSAGLSPAGLSPAGLSPAGSVFALPDEGSDASVASSFAITSASLGMTLLGGYGDFRGSEQLLDSGKAGVRPVETTPRHEVRGGGAALDVRYELLRLPRGAFVATFTPTFLIGEGKAWLVPFGLAYRFQ